MSDLLTSIPTEEFNLDLPPKERWVHIVEKNEYYLKKIFQKLDNLDTGFLGGFTKQGALGLITLGRWSGKVKHLDELQSIANLMKVSVNKVILMQLMYELSTCCTSSIINTDLDPIMIRTMDWCLDDLDPLTINLNVTKGGQIIYQATTWVGYVGILTAVRPGHYGVSVNYRRSYQNTIYDNFKACLSMKWPVGYLIREVLDYQLTYPNAVELFKKASLIAPCYITLVRKRPEGQISGVVRSDDDAMIIQRNQYPESDINKGVVLLGNKKTLTQTNIDQNCFDPEKDILWSIDRRHLANTIGEGLLVRGKGLVKTETEIQRTQIFEKYLIFPIKNDETRYISLMVPGNFNSKSNQVLDSRLVLEKPGQIPFSKHILEPLLR